MAFNLVAALRNLAIHGGRQAVHDATTDNLKRILSHTGDNFRKYHGDAMAMDIQTMIAETWQ
jgi:hypothetical protein